MSGINWQLGVMPNVGGNALAAFDQGMKMEAAREAQRQRELRKAQQAWAANPDDQNALNALMALDMQSGIRAHEFSTKRRTAERDDKFDAATADWITSGSANALLGIGRAQGAPGQPQDVPAPQAGPEGAPQGTMAPNALAAFGQPQGKWPSPDQAAQVPEAPPELPDSRSEGPDLSSLGQPQDGRDHAFLRMVQIDPVKALKIRSTLRDNFVDQLKDTQEVYGFAIDRLSLATDDASYQAALTELAPMAEAIGGNLTDHVPATYPGPDGMDELLMRAVGVKDRLTLLMRQADIDADNARADRNADSLIADRSARRAETRRNNQARDATTRRGQDKRGAPGGGRRGGRRGPVRVKSVAEAQALPPGTKFMTPDGRVKVRP